jgi:hypothetical protein
MSAREFRSLWHVCADIDHLIQTIDDLYGIVADPASVRRLAREMRLPKKIGRGHARYCPSPTAEEVRVASAYLWGYDHRN